MNSVEGTRYQPAPSKYPVLKISNLNIPSLRVVMSVQVVVNSLSRPLGGARYLATDSPQILTVDQQVMLPNRDCQNQIQHRLSIYE